MAQEYRSLKQALKEVGFDNTLSEFCELYPVVFKDCVRLLNQYDHNSLKLIKEIIIEPDNTFDLILTEAGKFFLVIKTDIRPCWGYLNDRIFNEG